MGLVDYVSDTQGYYSLPHPPPPLSFLVGGGRPLSWQAFLPGCELFYVVFIWSAQQQKKKKEKKKKARNRWDDKPHNERNRTSARSHSSQQRMYIVANANTITLRLTFLMKLYKEQI